MKLFFTTFLLVSFLTSNAQNVISAGLSGVNGIRMGSKLRLEKVVLADGLLLYNSDGSTAVNYDIISGTVTIIDTKKEGKILSGGFFDSEALELLKLSKGKNVLITFTYREPSGVSRISSVYFYVY